MAFLQKLSDKENMENKKPTSKICMNLTSSTGTWLNGCLQPQHYYVSLEIKDPEGKVVVRAGLSYEQAARMMLYNGDVECTLERYRNGEGKIVAEEVKRPETVRERMRNRLGETQEALSKRLEDIRLDIYAMVNGDIKPGKKQLQELLHEVEVVKSHMTSNQNFVVQQSEEELGKMQENAAGQLGIFLQSKTGIEASPEALKQLLPTGDDIPLLGEVKSIEDHYTLKEREQKPIDDMTAMQLADGIHARLKFFEKSQTVPANEHQALFGAQATDERGKVYVKYISYQGTSILELDQAKRYLKFLMSIKSIKEFKQHFNT